jgi:hypothetical protein
MKDSESLIFRCSTKIFAAPLDQRSVLNSPHSSYSCSARSSVVALASRAETLVRGTDSVTLRSAYGLSSNTFLARRTGAEEHLPS